MYNDIFQKEIKDIERELLNLKQVQGRLKNVLGYAYETQTQGSLGALGHTYKITYKKTNSPLISIFYSGVFQPLPLGVYGNSQYFTAGLFGGKVYILSTWEIENVEEVD